MARRKDERAQAWQTARLAYYERLLGRTIDLLEQAQRGLLEDGLDQEAEAVRQAVIALEDVWGALALRSAQLLPEQEEDRGS